VLTTQPNPTPLLFVKHGGGERPPEEKERDWPSAARRSLVVRAKKEEEDEEARQEMWKDWARDDNRPANEPSHPDMTEEDWWPKTGWAKTVARARLPARSCRSRRRARTCGSSG